MVENWIGGQTIPILVGYATISLLSTMLCHFSCSITVVVVDYDDVRLILLTV